MSGLVCLFCSSEGCHLCQPSAGPEWFIAGNNTPATHIKNVQRGLHPLGGILYSPWHGQKCGNCAHLARQKHHDKTYIKCKVHKQTRGPGTDVRVKWRACDKWGPAIGEIE